MEILTIYVLYSVFDDPQIAVEKWQLVSEESFKLSTEVAKEMGRTVAVVHNDSVVIGDPILELAIVSDAKIDKKTIPEINQRAINWLVDTGYGQPKSNGNIKWDITKMKQDMKR